MNKDINISRGCSFTRNEGEELRAQSVPGGFKMQVYDWVDAMPKAVPSIPKLIEVRFKNTRKAYFENPEQVELKIGDIIAVEGNPGVDVGIVSIVSPVLVERQIRRVNSRVDKEPPKKVLRQATSADIAKWEAAIAREHTTMITSRRISAEMGLDMKIGDVEFQGDGLKAIFYYIADGRVDFRELIKVFYERFRVRIEMKQIGARQEAGRIGGIGACGRELCCSGWLNHFSTIGIGAAKTQDLSFNPQKLAGQCSKLKCCLNYELDTYIDAKKKMPYVKAPLEAMDGNYYLCGNDPLTGKMFFSPSPTSNSVQIELSVKRVKEIMALNAKGEKVSDIRDSSMLAAAAVKLREPELQNELEDSLTRFDSGKKRGQGNRGGGGNRSGRDRNRDRSRGSGGGGAGRSGAKNASEGGNAPRAGRNAQKAEGNAPKGGAEKSASKSANVGAANGQGANAAQREGGRRPQRNNNNRGGRGTNNKKNKETQQQ